MKSFLEEYGFAILAAIVVILLIAMTTPVGSTIKEQVSGLVNSMSRSTLHKLQSSDNEISVILTTTPSLTIASKSNTDKFKYIVHYVENGEEKQTSPKDYQSTGFELGCNPDKHSDLYIEVIDIGTDKHYFSNVITVPNNGLSSINILPNTIIELENRNYVILQSKGNNQYLIMDIDGIYGKEFNRNNSNIYEGSLIDNYLNNDYYNTLSTKLKKAIVIQNIQQNFYSWKYRNPDYKHFPLDKPVNPGNCTGICVKQTNGNWIPSREHIPVKGQNGGLFYVNEGNSRIDGIKANLINRKIFLPSIEELLQIVNVNDQYDMEKFLCKDSNSVNYVWFRDGYFDREMSVLTGDPYYRSPNTIRTDVSYMYSHPTFVVDLSKVEFINTNNQFIK